jgi:hypothetical protein
MPTSRPRDEIAADRDRRCLMRKAAHQRELTGAARRRHPLSGGMRRGAWPAIRALPRKRIAERERIKNRPDPMALARAIIAGDH